MERKTIGAFLAVLRKANGMTQQQVADRLSVSNKTVSKWERDESLPDITLIPALAEMFHVTSDEILRGQRLEQTERTETAQEKRAEKTHSQARTIIARTISRHLNGTTIAAAILAVGMIALFTVSYAFYKPVLGFGVFMIFLLAGLVMEFLSTNRARTALTGGEMIDEDDALSAEKELLKKTKGLISAAAVLIVWALPLVLIRSEIYTDSVIEISSYLGLAPALALLSVLVWLMTEAICVRIWPELREGYERTEKKLRRLYAAAGCALALVLMAAFAGFMSAGSTVMKAAEREVWVDFDDDAAAKEFEEMAEDCAQGGEAWIDYCRENMRERGVPWKGTIADADRDYLIEHGFLSEPNAGEAGYSDVPEDEETLLADQYMWAFFPDMVNIDGTGISFEVAIYYTGDSETQFGILASAFFGAAVLAALALLRRRYILKAAEERRLHEQALEGDREEEPETEEDEE